LDQLIAMGVPVSQEPKEARREEITVKAWSRPGLWRFAISFGFGVGHCGLAFLDYFVIFFTFRPKTP